MNTYNWPCPNGLTPFAHQKETASFLISHRKAFVFNEQGTGKTASVIWASDHLMQLGLVKRVLIVCPLSIMHSAWQQDLFKFAVHRHVDVAYGGANKRKQIVSGVAEYVVINFDGVEIVKNEIIHGGFDLVVVDECFVAGTLVSTPLGRRPIEQLRPGDKVLTSDGVAPIKRLVRNSAERLVKVRLGSGQSIRCTPEHPFFTDAGWVCAKNLVGRRLISGVELSCLRAGISPSAAPGVVGYGEQPSDWLDLLKVLRTEEVALSEPQQELLLRHAARAAGQVHGAEVRRASGQTVSNSESTWAQTESAWGQRYGNDARRKTDFRGLACGVGLELPGSVGSEAARLSYELQARLCVAAPEGWSGSGREQPHSSSASSTGSQERSEVGSAWVESVSYIEYPDGVDVFNLEIEGTPNYFVGDHWLVHNCTAYKNPKTTRWKTMRDVMKHVKGLWMLTGTPAAQSPVDAYGLAKLVNPKGVPMFYGQFRDMVMVPVTQYRWAPKDSAKSIVHQVLQPAIRFEKAQCLDLPEVTYVDRDAPMTAQQNKFYKELKNEMLIEAADEEITAVNAAVKLNKLLQIACGSIYTDNGGVVDFDASSRLQAVREVVDEASHKVLIFVPFTHTINLIKADLTKHGVSCAVINGEVPVAKRSALVTEFQTKEEPRVLIIQPQAASHGLTLTAADTIIWYAPVTSVETYLQANARINRPGQRNAMTVVHIKGSPIEGRLYSMLRSNIDNHQKVVELYRQELETA